jgi:hypothetical protein
MYYYHNWQRVYVAGHNIKGKCCLAVEGDYSGQALDVFVIGFFVLIYGKCIKCKAGCQYSYGTGAHDGKKEFFSDGQIAKMNHWFFTSPCN